MTAENRTGAAPVAQRLNSAMNAHDLEAFLACFDENYESEAPAHPDRAFRGRDQVRRNWSAIFRGVPDFTSELIAATANEDMEWSEWHWRGTRSDGSALDLAGVIVAGVRDDRMIWGRLYVEPVEQAGAGITQAIQRMTGEN